MPINKPASRWRQAQKTKKSRERLAKIRLGIVFLGVIGGLMLASWLGQKAKGSIWDGKSNIGVVYQSQEEIKLVVWLPEYQRQVEWLIPGNSLVEVGFGFGEYQLKNLYNLGKLEGEGGKVLTRGVEELLGIGVAGFWKDKETNLTWWDRLRLEWQSRVRVKKSKQVDLSQEGVLTSEVLADGGGVFRPSQVLIDELVNQEIFDEKLVNEGLSLGVLNATGVDGVASSVARRLTNLGGEVRLVSNLDMEPESEIWISNKELIKSYTVESLSRELRVKTIRVNDIDEYRSDIVVIVGQDYTSLGASDKI